MKKSNKPHLSVMPEEFLLYFKECRIKTFFEGTLGAGGHAKLLLEAHPEIKQYIGCDQDPLALEIASQELSSWKQKLILMHGNFADLDAMLKMKKIKEINGCFFDIGVSSMQLDQGEKGFSFMREGPLDMRMDPNADVTAYEIVNKWTEKKLGELFKEYGEDPKWKRSAAAIVQARKKKPIRTTTQLADLITEEVGKTKKKLHPATLVFQALRICVNKELDVLKEGLLKAIDQLASGGRIGVISFHRLEDRIVKEIFKTAAKQDVLKLLTKKPLVPSFAEMRKNPRSRSAKMRFAEKL